MKQWDADVLKDERDNPQTTRRAVDGGERRKREEDLSLLDEQHLSWSGAGCGGAAVSAPRTVPTSGVHDVRRNTSASNYAAWIVLAMVSYIGIHIHTLISA